MLIKTIYKILVNIQTLIGVIKIKRGKGFFISYAGGISAGIGGPRIKIARLSRRFPQTWFGFNIIYCLSNSIYLYPAVVKIARIKGVKVVVNQNGVFYKNWFNGDSEKRNRDIKSLLENADHVLFQSQFCKRAVDLHVKAEIRSWEILYNAIDCSLFSPCVNLKNDPYTFLVTGKIPKSQEYRLLVPIEAIKILLERNIPARMIFAGDYVDVGKIQKLITDLQLVEHIFLVGRYAESEAPKIYRSADCYVTVTYMDNCPTAVIEAMASGLPVIYSRSGGVPELVGSECGIGLNVEESWEVAKIPSSQSVADAMEYIISRHHQFSTNARQRAVEKFDINKWYTRQETIFLKLAD